LESEAALEHPHAAKIHEAKIAMRRENGGTGTVGIGGVLRSLVQHRESTQLERTFSSWVRLDAHGQERHALPA
jgi:hypothetical protein